MNCPTCQHANVDNARFCAKCGTLLPTQAEEEVDRLIGQTVGGRYRIVKLLGEGGMGRVYEAERSMAGVVQRIAIKTLHQHLSSDAQVVARFNRECATLVGLKHPNTIRVEDFGQTDDGTLYIAMEFVDGVNVGHELERRGAMPPERVERIMEQVCGSLAEAHKTGIVHRDLKPDNIVLMNVGEDIDVVKVLDFGIAARKESADAKKEQKLTQQGMVLGTPPYMSPEQFMGKELDARSDIYSLGVMAYEMLTAKLPFDANTPWEWATKHMTAQPFPFEDMPTTTDIPGKMKHAIMRALAKNPNERQDNVKLFFEELRSGKIDNSLRPSLVSEPNSGTGTQLGMPTYGAPGGGAGTQMGMPEMGAGAPGFVSSPSMPGYSSGVPAVPAPPPPMAGGSSEGGGSNKTLIMGLVGAAGLLGVIAIGLVVSRMGKKDDGGTLNLNPGTTPDSSVAGPATVTALPSSTLPAATDSGVGKIPTAPGANPGTGSGTPATTATTTATTKTTTLSGDDACQDAQRKAGSDVNGALASYSKCSGPNQAGAKRAIAGAIPNAVQRQVFNGDCAGARRTASSGGSVGAPRIDVDSKYPQCKGK